MAPDLDAARSLAALAQVAILRIRGGNPAPRNTLERTRSRLWGVLEGLDGSWRPETAWRDGWSWERRGWRERAAYLNGNEIFRIDYEVCHPCRLGWVEQPYTHEDYQRCGLASAALKALRKEHPGLEWHTLGSHLSDSVLFWETIGEGVPGGYTKRDVCRHKHPGG
jgi:hypothetical protein